jgi:hypothetical protein
MPDSCETLPLLGVRVNMSASRDLRAGSAGLRRRASAVYSSTFLRSRNALLITDTELKLMATAAIIGESSSPKKG